MKLKKNSLSKYTFLIIIFVSILVFTFRYMEQNNRFYDTVSIQQDIMIEQDNKKETILNEKSYDSNPTNLNKGKINSLVKDINEVQAKINRIERNKSYRMLINNEISSSIGKGQSLKEYLESTKKGFQLNELQLIDEINNILDIVENYRENKIERGLLD